ncbi:hypothetical protein [Nisaea sp.]|uniref:hypothetical protein n=1 Tax=Nisaea sp. TaxID=2024842 RepID=UPI0032995E27
MPESFINRACRFVAKCSQDVFFTVLFTFLPIAIISTPVIMGTEKLDFNTIKTNFISYWTSGEIILPLLGVCGAIMSITISNRKEIHGSLFSFSIILSVIVAICGGYILGTNRGFKNDLLPDMLTYCFAAYFVSVAMWLIVNTFVEIGPQKQLSSDERASKLLNEAKERRAGESL